MLFIIYGTTTTIGYETRTFFLEHGFSEIVKKSYVPKKHTLKARFSPRRLFSKKDVKKCDFSYEYDGILVGLDKKQIHEVLINNEDAFMTITSDDLSFLEELKASYGDKIAIIFVAIDKGALKKMYKKLPDITKKEIRARMKIAKYAHKNFINHRSLFDYVAIYNGEKSQFDSKALRKQYEEIIKQAKSKQNRLQNRDFIELPYTGNEDYSFVSYAHKNKEEIYPILNKLRENGCRIWFDEGIYPGKNWREFIALKVEDCSHFCVFSSAESTESDDIRAEIGKALNCKKPILTIRLDQERFDKGIEMYLDNYQFISSKDEDKLLEGIINFINDKTTLT